MGLQDKLKGSLLVSRAVAHARTVKQRRTHPYGVVPERPRRVIVEPTNACNLKCSYCGNQNMERGLTMLPMPMFEKLVAEMDELDIRRLTLHTIGEPTLHKQLPKMIRLAKDAGIQVSLSTNGTRLTEDYVRELVAAGPDIVNLSIDAADPDKIRRLRPGLDPEAFYGGMKRLKRIRDEEGTVNETPWGEVRTPSIVATCVITSEWNDAEERAWFQKYGDYVDDVDLHWPNSHAGYVPDQPHRRRSLMPAALRDKLYEKLRISCPYPWDALFLLSNGEVSACHFDFDARLVVGRFGPQSLMEVWNGDAMNSIRKAHMDFDFTDWDQCKDCSAALYTNRHEDDLMSRKVKERNGFTPARDMWTGRRPEADPSFSAVESL